MSSNRRAQRAWLAWARYLEKLKQVHVRATPAEKKAFLRKENNKNSGRRTEWKNYRGPS